MPQRQDELRKVLLVVAYALSMLESLVGLSLPTWAGSPESFLEQHITTDTHGQEDSEARAARLHRIALDHRPHA